MPTQIFPDVPKQNFPAGWVSLISRLRGDWGSVFAWPSEAARQLCRDWRVDDCLGLDALRHEIGSGT